MTNANKFHVFVTKHPKILQFLEYWIGGGAWFFSGYAAFALLYSGLHIDWLLSKMIADVVGFAVNYFVQRYWAFYSPKLSKVEARTGMRYVAVVICNLALDYVIVASLKHYGVSPYLGMFISSLFFTIWNYVWYRFYVFRTDDIKG